MNDNKLKKKIKKIDLSCSKNLYMSKDNNWGAYYVIDKERDKEYQNKEFIIFLTAYTKRIGGIELKGKFDIEFYIIEEYRNDGILDEFLKTGWVTRLQPDFDSSMLINKYQEQLHFINLITEQKKECKVLETEKLEKEYPIKIKEDLNKDASAEKQLNKIDLYSDGSCLYNNLCGYASVLVENDKNIILMKNSYSTGMPLRMELLSIIEPLEKLKETHSVMVYNDCMAILQAFNHFKLYNEYANTYKKKMHLDLLERLYNLSKKHTIVFNHKKRKSNQYLKDCDKLARKTASEQCGLVIKNIQGNNILK